MLAREPRSSSASSITNTTEPAWGPSVMSKASSPARRLGCSTLLRVSNSAMSAARAALDNTGSNTLMARRAWSVTHDDRRAS
jgi:hypothetical protein